MDEQPKTYSKIDVMPIESSVIGVKKYSDCVYALRVLGVIFLICWIMAFCDLIGLIN